MIKAVAKGKNYKQKFSQMPEVFSYADFVVSIVDAGAFLRYTDPTVFPNFFHYIDTAF